MGLFKSNLSYLGVDIGSAGVKVVELKNEGGRPSLVTYGFAEEKIEIVHNPPQAMMDKTVALLDKVLIDSRATTKKTVAALPSFSVFSSIISLPPMKKKELPQAISWEAKKFVPLPLEEMTLDWKLLGSSSDLDKLDKKFKKEDKEKGSKERKTRNGDIKVLIAAAPKKLVMRYISIFKAAGLELLSLETENFALERALVGGSKTPVMIVDIGSITTDISVVEEGIPLLSRSVDSGGSSITAAIIQSLGVYQKRAEQFKRDIGFAGGSGNLPKLVESSITPIINEIKYCFDLYDSSASQAKIEKIILTGGSAFLPNITNYLSNLLGINVLIGDPWQRVIYPVELKSMLANLAPRFSVAVGLAMREIV